MKTYLFIFGRHPALSLAELYAFAETEQLTLTVTGLSSEVAVVTGIPEAQAETLLMRLAGTIKIAVVLGSLVPPEKNDVVAWTNLLQPFVKNHPLRSFGMSYYGAAQLLPGVTPQEHIALTLKKEFREASGKVRWVSGRGKPLSSVQVDKNHMVGETGSEFIIAVSSAEEAYIAKTLSVQPFEDWSNRDFGRPSRDARSGMLPPKLARLMVNLLGLPHEGTLLDPFCGSGTVLMEALLSGWTSVIGSDKSAKAVMDSQKNMEWLNNSQRIATSGCSFFTRSVEELTALIPERSVAAIVTEPDLGPALREPPTTEEAMRIAKTLVPLYKQALETFAHILSPGGRVVIVFPCWITQDHEEVVLPLRETDLPTGLRERLLLDWSTTKNTFIYRRPDQFVARKIVSFEAVL
ncbi:MAG: hypothetical protein WC817_02130 [Patescibacteria group bacterium]|jgi:tRNA G10  N-methylase Trm11